MPRRRSNRLQTASLQQLFTRHQGYAFPIARDFFSAPFTGDILASVLNAIAAAKRRIMNWTKLLQMVDHLKQHKGQLFYYLKLQGKILNTGDL
jgi:hypothetical protein